MNLKQLQINNLLNITQAINNNVSADELYRMYQSFLSWEMGIERMALFVSSDDGYECATHHGVPEFIVRFDIGPYIKDFDKMKYIYNHESEVISAFDIVIPVFHKDRSLAFSLIGGPSGDSDLLERLQFIITITNIIAVAIENKRLFKRHVDQEVLRQEMMFAMNMQNRLMPSEFLKNKYVDIHGFYKPKLDVGGDYYDIVSTSDREILLAIADISGKGVAAALLMSNIQAILRTLIKRTRNLNEILSEINATIHEMLGGDRFASMFLARYDVQGKKLYYVNAGHNPPLLLTNSKNEDSQLLEATSPVLGSVVALEKQKEREIDLQKGMQLLMYTDGLTEIMNREESFFNIDIIEQLLRDNCHMDSRDVIHLLLAEARDFAAKQDFVDDLTLLTCKFL